MTLDVIWEVAQPLSRCKGEAQRPNAALRDYARMGPGRSLAKLLEVYQAQDDPRDRSPTQRLNTLKNWSARYSWVARTAQWELLEMEAEDQAWRERRDTYRAKAYELANKALDRFEEMLSYPLTRRIITDRDEAGRPVAITIEPTNWNISSAARLLAEANKIGMLSLGEITKRVEQQHKGHLEVSGELSGLEDAELNDLIQQLMDRMGGPRPGDLHEPDFIG